MKDDVKVTRERRENEAKESTALDEADGRTKRTGASLVARAEGPFTSNAEYNMGMG